MLLCIYEGGALVHSSADLSMATDTEGLIHVIPYGQREAFICLPGH
jgi:hypothetical protein